MLGFAGLICLFFKKKNSQGNKYQVRTPNQLIPFII